MARDHGDTWGFALFGDDLRQEVGGKISLMGLYQSDFLFRGELPFVVAKFVILVMYYETVGATEGDIQFKIHLPGDEADKPSLEFPIPRATMPLLLAQLESEEDTDRIHHIRIPVVLSPLVIAREGLIKVRAHYEDGSILRLGRLQVRALRPDEIAANTVNQQA